MKKILILILLLSSLTACSQDGITLEEYGNTYYTQLNTIELLFKEELLKESVDLLAFYDFRTVYDHEDFVYYYDNMITALDNCLYEFSLIGPQLDDEFLMQHQAKLEHQLFTMMNTMKMYRESKNFNTNSVNQFSFYDEIYHLQKDISPNIIKINELQTAIDVYLGSQGVLTDQSYFDLKHKNLQAYAYSYAVLSARVASFQDYSGLQVSPWSPYSITNSSNDIFLTSELDFNIMLTSIDHLTDIKIQLDAISELSPVENLQHVNKFFKFYFIAYQRYAEVRSNFSYDFFKSGEFKDYQIDVSPDETIVYQSDFKVYSFDPALEDEHHLLQMQEDYYLLVSFITNSDHYSYMNNQE